MYFVQDSFKPQPGEMHRYTSLALVTSGAKALHTIHPPNEESQGKKTQFYSK